MKKTIIPIFIILLIIGIIYLFYNNSKEKYSCIDYDTNTTYTFKTEQEMHSVCDKFNGIEEDKLIQKYPIYKDLINANEEAFTFEPYMDGNNKLGIIIIIIDCERPEIAKKQAKEWFINHSYNIKDYTIDYEYPCIDS